MLYSIEGILREKHPTSVVVDVGGVSVAAMIGLLTYHRLPDEGERVRLYTLLFIRDEKLELYGFSSKEEREVFSSLISVPGIGARTALNLLSVFTPEELLGVIEAGEVSRLAKAPGIGRKKAERLVVELKGLSFLKKEEESMPVVEEAIQALMTLGLTRREAQSRVEKVRRVLPQDSGVEDIVRKALEGGK